MNSIPQGRLQVNNSTVRRLISVLSTEYGDPLLNNRTDPVDELVLIMLSEKTDEPKYLRAFEALTNRFSSWDQLVVARLEEIEDPISVAGMGKRRARLLRNCLTEMRSQFGSLDLSSLDSLPVDEAEVKLTALPGIGKKAARCILLYCFNKPVLPVDIHTYRLALRLGLLSRNVTYEQSHLILPPLVPSTQRRKFHVNAVAHGRTRCFANNPKCGGCPLAPDCSHPGATNPMRIMSRPAPLAIDLFAGAGGLSKGFERAGFSVALAVEQDEHAAETYSRNHPNTVLLREDIRGLDPHECLTRLALRPGDLTALIGGPPCQGFSESNKRNRTPSNPRNHMYREFVRFLAVMQPAWFVLENVNGIKTVAKGAILEQIVAAIVSLGYELNYASLNAADHGVPQHRRRLFIVGNRLGLTIQIPKPSHGIDKLPLVNVREAIEDLAVLPNGADVDYLTYPPQDGRLSAYQAEMRANCDFHALQGNLVTRNNEAVVARYPLVPPGGNWSSIPSRLMKNYTDASRCHTGLYYRLRWDEPSKVIGNFRKNMLIHPSQDRGLSVREAARIQSFPDDYVFLGSIGFQQQQVADAVPPKLAQAVAEALLAANRRARRAATMMRKNGDPKMADTPSRVS